VVYFPPVILVKEGRPDQTTRLTPAAFAASIWSLPSAISYNDDV
jgi:hypothetical protein